MCKKSSLVSSIVGCGVILIFCCYITSPEAVWVRSVFIAL
jgi:hypothetical protein